MRKAFPEVVLVRFSGDIGIKARPTRRQFTDRLQSNIADALRSNGLHCTQERTHNRILVRSNDAAHAEEILARAFGVQSVSRAQERAAPDLAAVVAAGTELFRAAVRGKRFAVRARHVGERSNSAVKAHDVELELGRVLLADAARVDLDEPEVTAGVEIFRNRAFFFSERSAGSGGLPLGVEGRALALISGGYDSAVAAWLLMKRGVALDYVFCNLGGASHQLGVLRVVKELTDRWSYGSNPRLYAIDFQILAQEIQSKSERRYWQLLLKRLMLRAAEMLVPRTKALALVTGEAVGQVSSQTLQNLAVISEVTQLPILRPLIGFNKEEIIALARRIGTADLSAVVQEYCAMVPRRPATAAALAAVQEQEKQIDPALLERAVAQCSVFELRRLSLDALAAPELELNRVPADATVIDLRSRTSFQNEHYPGALHLDFAQALAAYASFDRSQHYLLYCEFGLKSAHLVELMRRAGLVTHHFRGGWPALRKVALATSGYNRQQQRLS